jgi:hypothetical protein
MHRRILVCLLAVVLVAMGQQSITVQKLIEFVKSQVQLIKQKRGTDKELALSLASIRLSEKLDIPVIEDLQADGAGPLTVKALQKLMAQSSGLKAAVIQKALPDEPIPPPSSVEQGKILDEVREYVMNYDNSLPDFICLEVEQRMIAPNHGGRAGSEPPYRLADTITSKITYFHHEEKKEAILNGSRPINGEYEKLGGATSRGDFETALRMLFDTGTQTRFEWARWTTWRGRLTMVFSYHVSQDRSQYKIGTGDHKVERITAYSGEVFVDAKQPVVVRLTSKAEEIPGDFPIQLAETTLDYKYVDIGGQNFLLPYNGQVRLDGPDGSSKNVNRFDFYRKYEVGSSITFDIPKDFTPAPDSSKETPPVDCKDPKNKDAAPCKKQ